MQSYMIEISEEQRAMIVAALAAYKYPACFEAADREELDVLHGRLHDLPTVEADDPDVVHALNR